MSRILETREDRQAARAKEVAAEWLRNGPNPCHPDTDVYAQFCANWQGWEIRCSQCNSWLDDAENAQ